MSSENQQWSLLKEKRFLPLFLTQFLGAFNDNVFKNALIMLLTFNAAILPKEMTSAVAVNISSALFVLPYFLFSALAGQLADFKEKSALVFKLKILEVILMCIGTFSLFTSNVYLMWVVLFGLGTQSTFFGPLKYSILPQHLKEKELIGGNALVESGTFLAILTGTILGGVLIVKSSGEHLISLIILAISIIGCICAYFIPKANPLVSDQKVSFNIFKQSIEVIKIAREKKSVFQSILAISWFWFFGATLLSQFPLITKDIIGGDSIIVTLFLGVFSIGIMVGSLLCEKLSFSKVEIGLVPFGALGMIVFGIDLCFAFDAFNKLNNATIIQFMHAQNSYRILIDLFMLSVFGGFFTVPLYAFIQNASKPETRSRIIGANNIMNAIFMVGSAIFAIVVTKSGGHLIDILWGLMLLHFIVSLYVFSVVPEFLMRFIVWMLSHTIYRVKKEGMQNVPEEGAGLIICNHISFMDALIIFGSITRPVKFVMYYKIFNIPILKFLFKAAGAIPIASKKENDEMMKNAFIRIEQYLDNGELVVIFPEGAITHDGEMQDFKPGILKIIEKKHVDIIPSALSGLWGSMYSRKEKSVWRYIPKSFFGRNVYYRIGQPISTKQNSQINLDDLKQQVLSLRGSIK